MCKYIRLYLFTCVSVHINIYSYTCVAIYSRVYIYDMSVGLHVFVCVCVLCVYVWVYSRRVAQDKYVMSYI